MFKPGLFILLFFCFAINMAMATIFNPLPFEKQIDEATSAAEATLKQTRVFKDANGSIMTEYSFDVDESYNLSNDDLDNQQLKLTMIGGTLDGVTSVIDGSPQFFAGEKTFLLLKKVESKIYLSNFTLGKYKIQTVDGRTVYVSEVFPNDPNIGKISKEKMVELIKTKWKITSSEMDTYPEMKFIKHTDPSLARITFEKREPAQENENQDVPVFFWGAVILVSVLFGIVFYKIGHSGYQQKNDQV